MRDFTNLVYQGEKTNFNVGSTISQMNGKEIWAPAGMRSLFPMLTVDTVPLLVSLDCPEVVDCDLEL